MPRGAQIRREIAYSAVAVLIFGLVIGLISGYGIAPHTLLYTEVARYGWAYFWLSIALVILAHDTYFYWTHRLMHTPALFPYFSRRAPPLEKSHAVDRLRVSPARIGRPGARPGG